MDTCDALIVGGGPAGSTCAWKLRHAGLDVMVIDAAVFPREKLCAGWITPPVVAELDLDTEAYRQGAPDPTPGGRTFQPITGFRVGLIGGRDEIATAYGRPVSFGIRRCEFDHYLLQRSGARLKLGQAVTQPAIGPAANGSSTAPSGRRCWWGPAVTSVRCRDGSTVATDTAPVVVAQEAEFLIDARDRAGLAIEGEAPELYFCRDLKGYGWCFRKERYLNIGLGRLDRQSLPAATAAFVAFLKARAKISPHTASRWRGHAYARVRLVESADRRPRGAAGRRRRRSCLSSKR